MNQEFEIVWDPNRGHVDVLPRAPVVTYSGWEPGQLTPGSVEAAEVFIQEMRGRLNGLHGQALRFDGFPEQIKEAAEDSRAIAQRKTGYRLELIFSWPETVTITEERWEVSR